jgi:hypothetical protein
VGALNLYLRVAFPIQRTRPAVRQGAENSEAALNQLILGPLPITNPATNGVA